MAELLIYEHLAVGGDGYTHQWEELLSKLSNGWQIISAVESRTIIHYILLAPKVRNSN